MLGLVIALTRRFYFLTVTSEHVVLNSANRFTNRPGQLLGSWPRTQFPISKVKRGRVWSVAYVPLDGGNPKRINIHRYWRGEFDALLQAVGQPAQVS